MCCIVGSGAVAAFTGGTLPARWQVPLRRATPSLYRLAAMQTPASPSDTATMNACTGKASGTDLVNNDIQGAVIGGVTAAALSTPVAPVSAPVGAVVGGGAQSGGYLVVQVVTQTWCLMTGGSTGVQPKY